MKSNFSADADIGGARFAAAVVLAVAGLALAACAQKAAKPDDFSGFLGSYSDFEELEAGDGFQMVGWISPDLEEGRYNALILNPVTIHPPRTTFERFSREEIAETLAYLNRRMREEVSKQITLVNEPGPGVLQMRAAVTTASVGFKPLKWYQFTPITAATTVAGEATGLRDEGVQLIAESELIDTETGLRVAAGVRLGSSKVGTGEPIEVGDLTEVLDEWAESAGQWVAKNLN
jgi:hypothetical protein